MVISVKGKKAASFPIAVVTEDPGGVTSSQTGFQASTSVDSTERTKGARPQNKKQLVLSRVILSVELLLFCLFRSAKPAP